LNSYKNRLKSPKTILVTGGLGFIGSHFIERALKEGHSIINFDKETYASNPKLNDYFKTLGDYKYQKCDISEIEDIPYCNFILNFASESHVDNSIEDSFLFIKSNFLGTYNLLEILKKKKFENLKKSWEFEYPLFFQISTDETLGDIEEGFFKEDDRIKASNPYACAKAGAEQLCFSWGRTYKIPYLISRTTNNFGINQFHEKLIPKTIKSILDNEKVQVHGGGHYVRNWISVEDNISAIFTILDKGKECEVYHISSDEEYSVKEIVLMICNEMSVNYDSVVDLSNDRSGCDIRYALDCCKLKKLGWKQKRKFKEELPGIIEWYKNNL